MPRSEFPYDSLPPSRSLSFASYRRSFSERVLAVVRRIPRGSVLTYGEVAARAGSPRAFRAVGNLMRANTDPSVPCHRVISSDLRLGGYNRGESEKARRLSEEGVRIVGGLVVRENAHR